MEALVPEGSLKGALMGSFLGLGWRVFVFRVYRGLGLQGLRVESLDCPW